jgi:hypothetical protein
MSSAVPRADIKRQARVAIQVCMGLSHGFTGAPDHAYNAVLSGVDMAPKLKNEQRVTTGTLSRSNKGQIAIEWYTSLKLLEITLSETRCVKECDGGETIGAGEFEKRSCES